MSLEREPYSYKSDVAVPVSDAGEVFTVMDAQCALCARGAAWIARHDTAEEFTIIPLQSAVGSALMVHYGLDPNDAFSWLYLEHVRAYSSLDAFMRVDWRLGGRWKTLGALRAPPTVLQDATYRLVTRNRYRLFGKADLCQLPEPEVQRRLLT